MSTGRAARSIPWLVVTGLLAAALSFRGPIVAPTPVLRVIEHDLGVGAATVALLTTVPVLMFALAAPVAAVVIRRAGAESALLLSLVGVLAGTLVRAVPGFGWMLAGTLLIGASITVGNVVVPVLIRRDVPAERVEIVTAAYVATLNLGSLLTSLLTAPLAEQVGWPLALLMWTALTVTGLAVWLMHLSRDRARGVREPVAPADVLTGPAPVVVAPTAARSLFRRPVVWLLMATFACQAFMYYGLTTWLPALSGDLLGVELTAAGALASVFQGVAVIGAFVVPALARVAPPAVGFGVVFLSWVAVTFGVLLAPQLLLLWLVCGAIAHAGGFVVVFTVLARVARSDREAAGMSALVQGGGYGLAAVSGPVLGALHEVSGAWTVPLTVLAVVSVLYGVLLTAATRSASRVSA